MGIFGDIFGDSRRELERSRDELKNAFAEMKAEDYASHDDATLRCDLLRSSDENNQLAVLIVLKNRYGLTKAKKIFAEWESERGTAWWNKH